MLHRNLISPVLAAVVYFAASNFAQAACCPQEGAPAPAAACAPITRTITVMELVPETYETVRTSYRTEHVNETYTAYRTECVPETRTTYKTVTRLVPEVREECVTVCKCVPTCETRTVMKKVTVCKEVTTYTKKTVDCGHWECRCEPVRHRCGRKKSCDPCDPCGQPCQEYRTKKVWVSNKVCVETPCTKMVRSTECVPTTVTVTVNKMVQTTEVRKVCVNRCVSETVPVTCTVNVSKCVPYTATRCVAKCVPVQEKVLCTRMVCKPVCKTITETPAATSCACADTCCQPCCDPCCTGKAKKSRRCR